MPEETTKILLYGGCRTGKSTLMNRAAHPENEKDPGDWASSPYELTIGVEFRTKTVRQRLFHVWDTSGADRFCAIVKSIRHAAHILAFVCDASELASFVEAQQVFDDVILGSVPRVVVLVVNKCEVAVDGVEEAAAALAEYMQIGIDKFSVTYGADRSPILFERSNISISDSPSTVFWKLVGGHGAVATVLAVDGQRRPGSVRLPTAGLIDCATIAYKL